jgi:hypothetical protein
MSYIINSDAGKFKIAICCDTDPDYPHVPCKDINRAMIENAPAETDRKLLAEKMASRDNKLLWSGIETGIG